jgi:hypothetical protein
MNLLRSARRLIGPLVLCCTAAAGSTSVDKETREGRLKAIVTDPHEAGVVGAKVLIQNNRFRTEATANERGELETDLPIGVYRVSAQPEGFQKFSQKGVRVESGRTACIKIRLKVTGTKIKTRRDDIYL